MLAELLEGVVAVAVVPAAIMSASSLLSLAFYNRLAAIVSRLRSFQREKLMAADRLEKARDVRDDLGILKQTFLINMLSTQTDRVIVRANLIQRALFCFLGCVAALGSCSIMAGLGVFYRPLVIGAVVFFFTGLLALLMGIYFAIRELADALHPVELESEGMLELHRDFTEPVIMAPTHPQTI